MHRRRFVYEKVKPFFVIRKLRALGQDCGVSFKLLDFRIYRKGCPRKKNGETIEKRLFGSQKICLSHAARFSDIPRELGGEIMAK